MEGINGLDKNPLLDIAGMWLWIGFIFCVIGLVAGAVAFGYGYKRRHQGVKVTGLAIVPIALVGAVILGNLNGAIQWSSTEKYTVQALPKDAQKRTVTIKKNPPKVTCSEAIKYGVEFVGNQDETIKRLKKLIPNVLSDEDAKRFTAENTSREDSPRGLEYTPQGPDCTKTNTTPQQCTQVVVWTVEKSQGSSVHNQGNPEKVKHEFQSRGSSDCK